MMVFSNLRSYVHIVIWLIQWTQDSTQLLLPNFLNPKWESQHTLPFWRACTHSPHVIWILGRVIHCRHNYSPYGTHILVQKFKNSLFPTFNFNSCRSCWFTFINNMHYLIRSNIQKPISFSNPIFIMMLYCIFVTFTWHTSWSVKNPGLQIPFFSVITFLHFPWNITRL